MSQFTGSLDINGGVVATGNITASAFSGDGSGLTNIPAGTATYVSHRYLDYQTYSPANYQVVKEFQNSISASYGTSLTTASLSQYTASKGNPSGNSTCEMGYDGKVYYIGQNVIEVLNADGTYSGSFGSFSRPADNYTYVSTLKLAPNNMIFSNHYASGGGGGNDMIQVDIQGKQARVITYPTQWNNGSWSNGIVRRLWNDTINQEVLWGVRNDGVICYGVITPEEPASGSYGAVLTGFSSSVSLPFGANDGTYNDEEIFAEGQAPNGDMLIISRQSYISGGNARFRLHVVSTQMWDGDVNNINNTITTTSNTYTSLDGNGKYYNAATSIFFGGEYSGTFNGSETPYLVYDGAGTQLARINYDWRNKRFTQGTANVWTNTLNIASVAGTFNRPYFCSYSPDKQMYWWIHNNTDTQCFVYNPFTATNTALGTISSFAPNASTNIILEDGTQLFFGGASGTAGDVVWGSPLSAYGVANDFGVIINNLTQTAFSI